MFPQSLRCQAATRFVSMGARTSFKVTSDKPWGWEESWRDLGIFHFLSGALSAEGAAQLGVGCNQGNREASKNQTKEKEKDWKWVNHMSNFQIFLIPRTQRWRKKTLTKYLTLLATPSPKCRKLTSRLANVFDDTSMRLPNY